MKTIKMNELDSDVDEVVLDLVFEERTIRGTKKTMCVVEGTDDSEVILAYPIHFKSWGAMKKAFPKLEDILAYFLTTDYWRPNKHVISDRILTIDKIEGHKGLYEFDPKLKVCSKGIVEDEPLVKTSKKKHKM